jgi:hypothetical protein
MHAHGSMGGGGLLGLSGLFGGTRQGGGHMIEVVLGGKSTLYHVYKRPFVDFFLRKVCFSAFVFNIGFVEIWSRSPRGIHL